MPKREEIEAVQARIEDLTGQRFWAQGEFLRPVIGGAPEAGTPWFDLDFEDRREAIYVNTDWKGFSLDQQMAITDLAAEGESAVFWMEAIQASDQAEHLQAVFAEMDEERRAGRGESGSERFNAILEGVPSIEESPAVQPEIERGR